jgi:hypothetical protein
VPLQATALIEPADPNAGDTFGAQPSGFNGRQCVTTDGCRIVVGTPNANGEAGANVAVYERDDSGDWRLTATLTSLKPPDPNVRWIFGYCVALLPGDRATVSEPWNLSRNGSLYF